MLCVCPMYVLCSAVADWCRTIAVLGPFLRSSCCAHCCVESSSIASAHDRVEFPHVPGIPPCGNSIGSCTGAVFELHPAAGGFSSPFAVISSQLQPPPRRERALSCFPGSMDQLSSSEGLAPRRWPIHRARLAASASSLLQASEDRTPFLTGETAPYL